MGYVPKEIADESDGFEIELLGKRLAARIQPAPLFDANLERMREDKERAGSKHGLRTIYLAELQPGFQSLTD